MLHLHQYLKKSANCRVFREWEVCRNRNGSISKKSLYLIRHFFRIHFQLKNSSFIFSSSATVTCTCKNTGKTKSSKVESFAVYSQNFCSTQPFFQLAKATWSCTYQNLTYQSLDWFIMPRVQRKILDKVDKGFIKLLHFSLVWAFFVDVVIFVV